MAMKNALWVTLIISGLSLLIGIIWRFTLIAWPRGLEAQAYLRFTETALVFAAVLVLLMILGKLEKSG